jgi:hypothetical protein
MKHDDEEMTVRAVRSCHFRDTHTTSCSSSRPILDHIQSAQSSGWRRAHSAGFLGAGDSFDGGEDLFYVQHEVQANLENGTEEWMPFAVSCQRFDAEKLVVCWMTSY